jgi:hypothetical protein
MPRRCAAAEGVFVLVQRCLRGVPLQRSLVVLVHGKKKVSAVVSRGSAWCVWVSINHEAEGGAFSLSGPLPGCRAQGALCVERPFLTSYIIQLRVPQVRRLPLSTYRARNTQKFLTLCEGTGHPRPLSTCHLCYTRALSAALASVSFGFISSSSSSFQKHIAAPVKEIAQGIYTVLRLARCG